MNFEELKSKIEEVGVDAVGYEDYDEVESGLYLTTVHEVGGGEGGGDYVERVYEHDNDGEPIFVRITGYYSSYNGTDWNDGVKQVFPKQKTITVYE